MNDLILSERAITSVKEVFERELTCNLNLVRVSSPLVIEGDTGINDDLNGVEKPVSFNVRGMNGTSVVIVQSLAKWKRVRLTELGAAEGEGIVTDMRALRPDEDFSPLHSVYVDQWDWEKHISSSDRTMSLLKGEVRKIFLALRRTEEIVCEKITGDKPYLPEDIKFIHADQLARLYPDLSPGERENIYAEKYGAIFIAGIGGVLSDGSRHDGRAPDYDDWSTPGEDGLPGLNGDIIVWHPVLKRAFELSSMGIRVNRDAMQRQLAEAGCVERSLLPFHSRVLSDDLPQSIGGGIGQSRVCMFMLRKRHIGEVQVGIWPQGERRKLAAEGVTLM